ncbi:MAG: GNAT family N-acetyltransferase [Culicoidibacterales bacterium]
MARAEIVISVAGIEDLANIRQLLVDRSKWLRDQGINQWQQFATYEQTKQIRYDYDRSVLYIAKQDQQCVGAIVLTQAQAFDEQLWEQPKGYLYIHRYVVSLQARGQGIGEQLLTFAKTEAIRQKLGLRLDCRENNQQLVTYYQKRGWQQEAAKKGYARFEWPFSN